MDDNEYMNWDDESLSMTAMGSLGHAGSNERGDFLWHINDTGEPTGPKRWWQGLLLTRTTCASPKFVGGGYFIIAVCAAYDASSLDNLQDVC